MIRKIFHISDLHLPNDEKKRPYMDMIKQGLADLLREIKKYERDEIRIVVAGDIFHNKIKTTNEARVMFHKTMNYLNSMAQTIIIAGNHDMLENNHDRIDSITPSFEIEDCFSDTTYADKTLNYKSGCIVDENIVWVLYSIFDKYTKPNIDDIREDYPDKTIVGLYHGDIVGAVTDTGRITEKGIDTSVFSDCDFVIAGHIHKFQCIKKEGVPIVYSGSMFQQNVGENTTMHGFVIWDVETHSFKHIEVKNDYKMYKFKISSYEDVSNDTEHLLNL